MQHMTTLEESARQTREAVRKAWGFDGKWEPVNKGRKSPDTVSLRQVVRDALSDEWIATKRLHEVIEQDRPIGYKVLLSTIHDMRVMGQVETRTSWSRDNPPRKIAEHRRSQQ